MVVIQNDKVGAEFLIPFLMNLQAHSSTTHPQDPAGMAVSGEGSGSGGTGPFDPYAVRSSSSGEFFTAREDSTLKSSDDDPSRPKSWDSSILGQVSGGSNSNSEYATALSAGSGQSGSESYLGSLSSDASQSETLVASQISLARDRDRDFLLDDDDNSASASATSPPPPLPPRDHPKSVSGSQTLATQSPSKGSQVEQRSVHCEAGPSGETSGYPVTLTSSTSGTTVCTQVETSRTFEAQVKGEPTREDDQEGNIMVLEHDSLRRPSPQPTLRSASMSEQEFSEPPRKTHRRSESQSWTETLVYGVEEQIRGEEVVEEEISDLFSKGGSFNQRSLSLDEDEDPIQRPITPEPGFSPEERKTGYYPGSSFDIEQNRRDMGEGDEGEEEEDDDIIDYPRSLIERDSIFDRMGPPSSRLEGEK